MFCFVNVVGAVLVKQRRAVAMCQWITSPLIRPGSASVCHTRVTGRNAVSNSPADWLPRGDSWVSDLSVCRGGGDRDWRQACGGR